MKNALRLVILALVVVMSITAVFAATRAEKEQECVAKPPTELGIAAITQGASFIFGGGTGPIIILVIAFIIGMIVSHVIWGGF